MSYITVDLEISTILENAHVTDVLDELDWEDIIEYITDTRPHLFDRLMNQADKYQLRDALEIIHQREPELLEDTRKQELVQQVQEATKVLERALQELKEYHDPN